LADVIVIKVTSDRPTWRHSIWGYRLVLGKRAWWHFRGWL